MSLAFESRPSNSPYVQALGRVRAESDTSFTVVPDGSWGLIVRRSQDAVTAYLTGLTTGPIRVDLRAGDEIVSVSLAASAYSPNRCGACLLNKAQLDRREVQGVDRSRQGVARARGGHRRPARQCFFVLVHRLRRQCSAGRRCGLCGRQHDTSLRRAWRPRSFQRVRRRRPFCVAGVSATVGERHPCVLSLDAHRHLSSCRRRHRQQLAHVAA